MAYLSLSSFNDALAGSCRYLFFHDTYYDTLHRIRQWSLLNVKFTWAELSFSRTIQRLTKASLNPGHNSSLCNFVKSPKQISRTERLWSMWKIPTGGPRTVFFKMFTIRTQFSKHPSSHERTAHFNSHFLKKCFDTSVTFQRWDFDEVRCLLSRVWYFCNFQHCSDGPKRADRFSLRTFCIRTATHHNIAATWYGGPFAICREHCVEAKVNVDFLIHSHLRLHKGRIEASEPLKTRFHHASVELQSWSLLNFMARLSLLGAFDVGHYITSRRASQLQAGELIGTWAAMIYCFKEDWDVGSWQWKRNNFNVWFFFLSAAAPWSIEFVSYRSETSRLWRSWCTINGSFMDDNHEFYNTCCSVEQDPHAHVHHPAHDVIQCSALAPRFLAKTHNSCTSQTGFLFRTWWWPIFKFCPKLSVTMTSVSAMSLSHFWKLSWKLPYLYAPHPNWGRQTTFVLCMVHRVLLESPNTFRASGFACQTRAHLSNEPHVTNPWCSQFPGTFEMRLSLFFLLLFTYKTGRTNQR